MGTVTTQFGDLGNGWELIATPGKKSKRAQGKPEVGVHLVISWLPGAMLAIVQ